MKKSKEKVFVVIVTFNGQEMIRECLESVKNWPIVVVDNGSAEASVRNLKSQISKLESTLNQSELGSGQAAQNSKLKLIENQKNLGFAGGVNAGIKYALGNRAEYVFLVNQDAVVEQGAIKKLVEIMEKDKKIGICGSLVLKPDKSVWSAGGGIDRKRYSGGHRSRLSIPPRTRASSVQGRQHRIRPDRRVHSRRVKAHSGRVRFGGVTSFRMARRVDFVSGCAMMIKKEVFEKIGFFDEKFFLYYEDVDFCLRAKKAGFQIFLVPQAIVYHHFSEEKRKLRQYYLARNHLLFVEKHAPWGIKIREMIRLPKTLYEHLRKGEREAILGIRDYFLGSFASSHRPRSPLAPSHSRRVKAHSGRVTLGS